MGTCGPGGIGNYVKFTTGGVAEGEGSAQPTAGSPLQANYIAIGDAGTFEITSVTLDGAPVLISEAIGGSASINPQWVFPLASSSPLLAVGNTNNFSQFALCVYDRFGPLDITKTVDSGSGTFDFTVVCTAGDPAVEVISYSLSITVTDGSETVRVADNVPALADCTVTETSSGNYDDDGPKTVTIVEGGPNGVTINNTLRVVDVTITKTTTGQGPDATFTIDLVCDGAVVDTVMLRGGETATVSNVPIGANCQAVEQDPGGSWEVTNSPTVVVAAGVGLEVTNNWPDKTVVATKAAVGDTPPAGATFSITISCDNGDSVTDDTVMVGGSVSIAVPEGTDCTASEGPLDDLWTLESITVDGDAITVTNRYTAPPPAFQGCTPGYWRQAHHYDSWTGIQPTDYYDEVFGFGPHITLAEAVSTRGNATIDGVRAAVLRHSVAALLNALSFDVSYQYTPYEVFVLASENSQDPLVLANERDCPLN